MSRSLMFSLALLGLSTTVQAATKDDLHMFPTAAADQQRWVIRLPAVDNEDARKVEILASKTLAVDCNKVRLAGDLETADVQGWGYSYHTLKHLRGPLSTMMACPEKQKHQVAVPVRGEGYLLRYNSRLPLVIYTPKDVQLQYRIWQPGAPETAPQG